MLLALLALLAGLVAVFLHRSGAPGQNTLTWIQAINVTTAEVADEADMLAEMREGTVGGTPYAAFSASDKPSADGAAPAFTLPDLFHEETTYTLSAYRGQPVILNFWASWCVPCRREMPALEAAAAQYRRDGLVLLGMNQTYLDSLEAAQAFVEELGLTFPNTRDDSGAVGKHAYQVVGIPTTVFVNRNGSVAHIQIGEMSRQQITDYAERLVAGESLQP